MKKEYRLQDGGLIAASSPEQFVTNLRLSSKFGADCSDAEYMVSFAARMLVQSGAIVRTDTASNFMDDLKDIGYIQ